MHNPKTAAYSEGEKNRKSWLSRYSHGTDPVFHGFDIQFHQIEACQQMVRSISFQPRLSPSLPIFKDLTLLKLFDIFKVRLLTFVYDSINKTSPCCFHNFYLFSSSVHRYSTRQASQGDLYLFRKDSLQYGLKSL